MSTKHPHPRFYNRRVKRFYLGTWSKQQGLLKILSIARRIQQLTGSDIQVTFRKRIPSAEAQAGLEHYQKNMTAGKILLVIDPEKLLV